MGSALPLGDRDPWGPTLTPRPAVLATHSESEPSAWALPTHTFMATPLRCSRPGSLRAVLMVMTQSGAWMPSPEPREEVREDAGLCSQSASFSRSRHLSG